MRGDRCWTATYDFSTGGFRFCELPILARTRKGVIVEDEGKDVLLDELNENGSDCVAGLYRSDEPLDEIKSELEERLRLKMAHRNICEPHILLKEV